MLYVRRQTFYAVGLHENAIRRNDIVRRVRAYHTGILCGWSGLLEQSTIRSAPTLSTFKNMLKTHLFSRSYFTKCSRVRAANLVRRACSDSGHVIKCRFIIIYLLIYKTKVIIITAS